MKRTQAESSHEFADSIISFLSDTDQSYNRLTKAEHKIRRKIANREWKYRGVVIMSPVSLSNFNHAIVHSLLIDRHVDSGKDPNPRHTLYYKSQIPALSNEEEWRRFQSSLVEPLPVTFRIGSNCPSLLSESIRSSMDNEFKYCQERYVEVNGKVLTGSIVKRVDVFGKKVRQSCWQVEADSHSLAKNESLRPLLSFLNREVGLGHVIRQELVSMIPALLLDVQSHHVALDVCAAPGSKTEQLLSLLTRQSGTPTGMIVGNDADMKRIQTLKARYSKCGSPNLLLTCARAEDLQRTLPKGGYFDRILADVPCSGDGTFRKCPHLWRLFRPRQALELHLIQLQIAEASVLMLKPGGRFVYSTCSLNPLEDEAVVAGLLRKFKGRLRLIDTRAEGLVPAFKTHEGLRTWRCDNEIFVIGEPDSASASDSKQRMPQFTVSMFPPDSETAVEMCLERCHRVLPHDQDTGGFFVAVFELLTRAQFEALPVSRISTNKKYDFKIKKGLATTSGVSVEQAAKTMKKLGYNPKVKRNNSNTTSQVEILANRPNYTGIRISNFDDNAKTVHSTKPNISITNLVNVIKKLHFPTDLINVRDKHFKSSSNKPMARFISLPIASSTEMEQESIHLNELTNAESNSKSLGNGLFGSYRSGWSKKSPCELATIFSERDESLHLVSEQVHNAINSWAVPDFIVQAGIEIGSVTVCSSKIGEQTSPRNIAPNPPEHLGNNVTQYIRLKSVNPESLRVVMPYIVKRRIVGLLADDFLHIASLASKPQLSKLGAFTDGPVLVVRKSVVLATFENKTNCTDSCAYINDSLSPSGSVAIIREYYRQCINGGHLRRMNDSAQTEGELPYCTSQGGCSGSLDFERHPLVYVSLSSHDIDEDCDLVDCDIKGSKSFAGFSSTCHPVNRSGLQSSSKRRLSKMERKTQKQQRVKHDSDYHTIDGSADYAVKSINATSSEEVKAAKTVNAGRSKYESVDKVSQMACTLDSRTVQQGFLITLQFVDIVMTSGYTSMSRGFERSDEISKEMSMKVSNEECYVFSILTSKDLCASYVSALRSPAVFNYL